MHKSRSQITYPAKTNNLNYLIDPRFTKVIRLYVLPFKNENDRTSFLSIIHLMLKLKTTMF